MKNFDKSLYLLVFLLAITTCASAQNVQKDVDDMYSRREVYDEQQRVAQAKQRQDSLLRVQDNLLKEQIKAQIIAQREKEKEDALERIWAQIVGPGPVMPLDRKKVEKALAGHVDLNEFLKLWEENHIMIGGNVLIKPKYDNSTKFQPEIKYFPGSTYMASTKNTEFKSSAYQIRDMSYIKDAEFRNAVSKASGIEQATLIKGIDLVKIYHGPSLLFKVKPQKCVFVDAAYNVYDPVDCEKVAPYYPVAQQRQKALRELGFSEETIDRYANNNPWNLVTYAACDNFDGHELVEKVVMAWRYSSIANNPGEGRDPNHYKQYRYVFMQKDGKEQEEAPKEREALPKCLDVNRKERDFLHKSDTQQAPPNHEKQGKMVWDEHAPHEGCFSGVRYYPDWTFKHIRPDRESLLDIDEQWFF